MSASTKLDRHVSYVCAAVSAESTDLMVRAGPNALIGTVVSIQIWPTRTSILVGVGQDAQLFVRWPTDRPEQPAVRPGDRVEVRIPAEVVLVNLPEVRLGKPSWNRWPGRVVWAPPDGGGARLTLKLRGEPITLQTTNPVVGLPRRPQTWDLVTIVVDPKRAFLYMRSPVAEIFHERASSLASSWARVGDRHVWLKGGCGQWRRSSGLWVLWLTVGDAQVSAHLGQESSADFWWEPGTEVEVSIEQWDAWIRPAGFAREPVGCRLAYES